jgi:hypothetical protein
MHLCLFVNVNAHDYDVACVRASVFVAVACVRASVFVCRPVPV